MLQGNPTLREHVQTRIIQPNENFTFDFTFEFNFSHAKCPNSTHGKNFKREINFHIYEALISHVKPKI